MIVKGLLDMLWEMLRSAQHDKTEHVSLKIRREWMGVEPTAARNATRHRF